MKLKMNTDLESRIKKLEQMEVKMLKVERNLYYTIGAMFGALVFLSACSYRSSARFSALA